MDTIEEISLDIERCEKVLKENHYLEIIIAIEELQDKYRNKINFISETYNDVVWNYSMKDLENIRDYLINYREELILENKLESIYEKISQLKLYMENNHIENKNDLIMIIDIIENTNNQDITLNEKYENFKNIFEKIKDFDRHIAAYILELIALVIK